MKILTLLDIIEIELYIDAVFSMGGKRHFLRNRFFYAKLCSFLCCAK